MKKDYFILALGNLKHRGLRSWLTILGVFIGIAAVVALISLGQGLQNGIEKQFENLGKDKIVIQPVGMGPPGSATSESLILTSKDLEFIKNINGVDWTIGYLIKTGQAKFKDEAKVGYGIGINPEDFDLSLGLQGVKIIEGRGLKDEDKFKAVLGYNHAVDEEVWERGIKVGEKIEIEGYEFKVVGIIEKIGNPFDDGAIYVPKETLKEILNVKDEESQIIAKVEEGADVNYVAEEIERRLRNFRNEKEGQETFSVSTSEQLLNSFQDIFGIVQAVLIGIAAISLFVGGIGIMNTMYTSVLERTKEIGVMKAVGAKNSDILYIFLFESGFLGLVGGIIGVVFGIALSKGVEYIAANFLGTNFLEASMDLTLIFGALIFSFLVGAVSGVFPAMQAARLKPVDALRHE
ncbi:ABC transporter permease [Candidatus Pacearchaeota archaeon]|nr:ABC transporter permease [Candidatus Pacearchaeota archaeon]